MNVYTLSELRGVRTHFQSLQLTPPQLERKGRPGSLHSEMSSDLRGILHEEQNDSNEFCAVNDVQLNGTVQKNSPELIRQTGFMCFLLFIFSSSVL